MMKSGCRSDGGHQDFFVSIKKKVEDGGREAGVVEEKSGIRVK